MEEMLRKKALAVLVGMIFVLGIYGYCLFVILPEDTSVIFGFIDDNQSVLDNISYSNLLDMVSQSYFQENYSLDFSPDYGMLAISSVRNPDVVFTFMNYSDDLYIMVDGCIRVGPLGYMEGTEALPDEMLAETNLLLERMGYAGQTGLGPLDSRSGTGDPQLKHLVGFFGLGALIVTHLFASTYRKGWLLENPNRAVRNADIIAGMTLLFNSFGIGLVCAWITLKSWGPDEILVCWAVPAAAFIIGMYLVVDGTKKSIDGQIPGQHPPALTGKAP